MVLFNNHVDKQQILTMFRQMYPENPQHMLRHFEEVTFKAYGSVVASCSSTYIHTGMFFFILYDPNYFWPVHVRLNCVSIEDFFLFTHEYFR